MYQALVDGAVYLFSAQHEQDLEYRMLWLAWLYTLFFGLFSAVIPAPYGRFCGKSQLPILNQLTTVKMPAAIGWCLQELPALLISLQAAISVTSWLKFLLLLPFLLHYFNRGIIYPIQLRRSSKDSPLMIVLNAFFFCGFNGLFQSQAVMNLREESLVPWLSVLGFLTFVLGMGINLQADSILRSLRPPGESGYRIPRGGLYSHLSCPNYFGEVVEWWGWAAITQTHASLWFAIWTLVFLGARAVQTHTWYLDKFGAEYPAGRKAFVPFIL